MILFTLILVVLFGSPVLVVLGFFMLGDALLYAAVIAGCVVIASWFVDDEMKRARRLAGKRLRGCES